MADLEDELRTAIREELGVVPKAEVIDLIAGVAREWADARKHLTVVRDRLPVDGDLADRMAEVLLELRDCHPSRMDALAAQGYDVALSWRFGRVRDMTGL